MVCFEDGGRAVSQGMQAASRSWKKQADRFPSEASRRNVALQIPWF